MEHTAECKDNIPNGDTGRLMDISDPIQVLFNIFQGSGKLTEHIE